MQSITLLILKKAMHTQHIFWGAKLISQSKKNDHAPKLTTIGFHHATKLHTKWGGGDTKNLVLCLLQAATSLPQNLKAKLDKSVKMRNVRYTANWCQVYFVLYVRYLVWCNSQNKLGASWRCILQCWMATAQCKILPYITVSLFSGVRYTANWCQVYFGSCTIHIRRNKLGTSWRCILHHRTVTGQFKILHHRVAIRLCKIHCQLAPSLFWELHSTRYI